MGRSGNLRVAFFGTPEFVVGVLERLTKEGYELAAVVTAPAKPVGRGQRVSPGPVALWAKKRGFKVLAPEKLDEEFTKKLAAKRPDVAVVAAYGKILPGELLQVPKYGFLNVHPSLLPLYRGPSPVSGAIVAGEKETGVTIMKLDEEMDHGPLGGQTKTKIDKQINRGELTEKLFDLGAEKLIEVLGKLTKEKAKWAKQNHKRASYTRRLKREDGFIPQAWLVAASQGKTTEKLVTPPPLLAGKYKVTPELICSLIRGLSPWPGVWTKMGENEARVKILEARLDKGRLKVEKVQMEGKKPASYAQFSKVYGEMGL